MESVIIAAGSNLGDRHDILQNAGTYLDALSLTPALKSSIWETEPVGPSKYTFLNAVANISTDLEPFELLKYLKSFEHKMGREKNSKRWSPRILDLDVIAYGSLVIHRENLIIPHPEYIHRLFVLLPMKEIAKDWLDPISGRSLDDIINSAPNMRIEKTNLTW